MTVRLRHQRSGWGTFSQAPHISPGLLVDLSRWPPRNTNNGSAIRFLFAILCWCSRMTVRLHHQRSGWAFSQAPHISTWIVGGSFTLATAQHQQWQRA
jgi:hypothetical protein